MAKVAVAKAMATEGGRGGIRTRDHLAAIHLLQRCALDQLCDPSCTGYYTARSEMALLCHYNDTVHPS